MFYNGNNRKLNHAVAMLQGSVTQADQAKFNGERVARAQKALGVRPVWIPLQYTITAAGQATPYRKITPAFSHDIVIVGAITDNGETDLQFVLTEMNQDVPFVSTGESAVVSYGNLSDIAGASPDGVSGQRLPLYWPTPYLLQSQQRLTLGLFKTAATADDRVVNVVLIGYRVNRLSQFGEREKADVERSINRRRMPRPVWIKQSFDYTNGNVGTVKSNVMFPQQSEPVLLLGAKTNLRQSLLQLNIEGEPYLMPQPTPIWAIAGHDSNGLDSYIWFQRPIYLAPNQIFNASFTNGANGKDTDDAVGSYLTWIAETI